MDAATMATTSDFVKNVAQYGSRISNILHNFASLEGSVGHSLSALVGNLDASIHFLNQICGLISLEQQPTKLLNDEGLKYVETLAEECSIAIDKIKWLITGDNRYELGNYSPKYWKSPVSTNEKGQKALMVSDLDEAALFRDMKAAKGRALSSSLSDPAERLDYLQLLLLLVVQVMTVQDMTKKLPSGGVDLACIVDYHTRIVRAARRLSIASGDGTARHGKSGLPLYSPYISSGSDSDVSIRRVPPPCERKRSVPPPPPPGWKPFIPPPPSPPKEFVIIEPDAPFPPDSSLPSVFSHNLPGPAPPSQIVEFPGDTDKSAQNVNPPSYTEKDGAAENATVASRVPSSVTANSSENPKQVDEKSADHKQDEKLHEIKQDEKSPDPKVGENSTKNSPVSKAPKPATNDDARLLSSPSSGLGMKFKSLFRSKSSLEAEMKRTLSDADASLKAFIVQHRELRKVPHSAFHSLEYTHMRTILWQLKDNTWFKTFSDLTDAEHDAMEKMLQKFYQDGKWFQRELVVLKIMQENKYNAWMRVMEDCMGIEWGKPHHENYRIILAIVREKECENNISVGPIPPFIPRPRPVDCYDPPQVPRLPDPLPTMDGDKMLVDLDKPEPARGSFAFPRGPPPKFPPPGAYNLPPPPPPGWMGPPSAPLPNINDKGPLSPSGEIQLGHSEVIPHSAISDESAREALTSYEAFTFRPALQQQSPLAPLLHLPPRTWSRCFITREREETKVLLQRIEKFRLGGISIIDLKIQLTEPQASQVTNLVQELNQLEKDKRFEHKMVELSMVDREYGIVTKQTAGTNIDVIHVITQRTLKQGVPPLMTYNGLMNRPPPLARGPPPFSRGPPPPPPQVRPNIIEVRARSRSPPRRSFGRGGRRSIASYSDSDSDSSIFTVTTSSSVGYHRKGRKGRKYHNDSDSDSSSDEEFKARWKIDPIAIKFSKKEKGKDVVQLLLEKWTPAGDGKVKEKEETKEEKDAKKKKKRSRRRRVVSDSDSLADD